MRILIVDDDEQLRLAICTTLRHLNHECLSAPNAKEALLILSKQQNIDLILSDLKMPKVDGIELLKIIKSENLSKAPFVIMTAFGTIETAVLAMKLGAFDFLVKPFSKEALEKVIALSQSNLSKETLKLEVDEDFVFVSQKMKDVLILVEKVAPTDASVLLIGETGTGKEVVAKLIHKNSNRAKEKFISVNCAAIPSNLLESELFGYEKGAFTGAVKSHKGKFELAHKGTLLLDEISEMPLELQSKLLRVLQEQTIDKLGATQSIPINDRIICTTNRNLQECIKNGTFREDLFYRISVFPITIPPLRERPEDIEPLCSFFLKNFNKKIKKNVTTISKEVLNTILNYNWPGNVRELEHTIERAIILTKDNTIKKDDIFLHGI